MTDRRIQVHVGPEPIDVAAPTSFVGSPAAGAIVVFLGTVRDHSEDRGGVTHLEYQAYDGRVEPALETIADEAFERWPLEAIAVWHRVGAVPLEEASVVVAVSAGHRGEAFDAARYVIDELKARAPIWKKEFWPGGSEWSKGS